MHSYYAENKEKLKKGLGRFMQLVKPELEKTGGKPSPALLAEIWDYYEKNLFERFSYIGVLVEPVDVSHCNSLRLPAKDTWG